MSNDRTIAAQVLCPRLEEQYPKSRKEVAIHRDAVIPPASKANIREHAQNTAIRVLLPKIIYCQYLFAFHSASHEGNLVQEHFERV